MFIHDFDGNFVDANPAALELLGYEKKDVPNLNLRNLLGEDQIPTAEAAIRDVVAEGSRKDLTTYKLRRKDGKVIWIETKGSLICKDGEPHLVQGIIRDITARRMIEEALEASEERFRAFFHLAPLAYQSLDQGGCFLEVNDTWCELLGYARSEVVGKNFADVLTSDCVGHFLYNFPCFLENGEIHAIEFTMVKKDGGHTLISLDGKVAREANGKFKKTHCILSDITARREAENELGLHRDHLEELVAERTRKLSQTNDRLQQEVAERKRAEKDSGQARRTAEEANRGKSRFLSSMSHELRTPLNGVLGFADLLHNQFFGTLNAKQLEYVQFIEQSGKHLLDLITDLLDFSKAEIGAIQLYRDAISLKKLIDTVIEMLDSQARENVIKLEVKVDQDLLVDGDERRCKQILINLLGNAIKFSPDGGQIDVRAEVLDDSHVTITVRDQGIGISDEELSSIFSEFYQADHVRDAELGGSGIGLALTRKLVELHGGKIGVRSEPGRGSEFWFTLPLWREQAPTVGEVHTPLIAQKELPSGRRILVAEDNETNLKLILSLLEVHHHHVRVARNGRELFEVIEGFHPELILMDLRMPVINGFDATQRLRSMDEYSSLPIIAVTASVDAASVRACLESGCDGHLSKPIRADELFSFLDRYLPPIHQDGSLL